MLIHQQNPRELNDINDVAFPNSILQERKDSLNINAPLGQKIKATQDRLIAGALFDESGKATNFKVATIWRDMSTLTVYFSIESQTPPRRWQKASVRRSTKSCLTTVRCAEPVKKYSSWTNIRHLRIFKYNGIDHYEGCD